MKTPLLVPNDSRDESRDKDSWGTNILLESEAPTAAVKRPGLTLTYDGTTTGQGVFIWPEYGGYAGSSGSGGSGGFGGFGGSTVVTIEDDELTFPVIVAIGDLIDGYYAMVENPPTPPGPDDDYWSLDAPDSRRYQAWSLWEISAIVDNDPDYWAAHAYTSASGSTNCFCTTKLAASPKAAARQALRYLRKSCPGYSYQHTHTFTYLGGLVETYSTNYVVYYPYRYIFKTVLENPEDAVISVANDTICTDVSFIYGVSTVCAYVYLNMKTSYSTGSPTASDPVCALAGNYYDAGLSIVRRI